MPIRSSIWLIAVIGCTARTDLSLHALQPGDRPTDGAATAGNDGAAGDPTTIGDPAIAGDPTGDPAIAGDPTTTGDPGGALPSLTIIGSLRTAGASYLDMAIDWTRKLAFVSSGAVDGCFDVINFADETNPKLSASYNMTSTPATGCVKSRGLALFAGNTRLVVTCGESSLLEVWDVSAHPEVTPPSLIVSVSTYHPRRIPLITEAAQPIFYVNHRNSARYHTYDEGTPAVTEGGSWLGTDNQAAATVISTDTMLTTSWVADAPIHAIDLADMSLANTFDMTNGVEANAFACAASSGEKLRSFVGGWVSAFFSYSTTLTITRRFNNDGVYRDAVFVGDGSGDVFLYALRNDMVLDLFDATDINTPTVVGQSHVPVGESEAYSIRVNSTTRRLLIATTNGDFLVADQDSLAPATDTYPPL